MKAIRTAALRCVYKVVIILLITTLLLTGCKEAEFECGQFGYTYTPDQIMFGARSATDTFSIDNVKFDLYYALYDFDYGMDNRKNAYCAIGHDEIFVVLYVCNYEMIGTFKTHMWIDDYKNQDGYYIVKTLSEDEAFSEEYGYKMRYLTGIKYNHKEEILIPDKFFNEKKGTIAVSIVAFNFPLEGENQYLVAETNYIKFDYEKINYLNVRLEFNNY